MPLPPLVARVADVLRHHRLAGSDTRVVAAVSGGPDSVALAHVLDVLDRHGALRLAGLAHVNHQLRGAASDADEQLCEQLAARLGRRLVRRRVDVLKRARRDRLSLEHAARVVRYEALESARGEAGADVIALGHTREDQAETFLLRLLRGAGPKGLAGMHPRNGSFVRPLLYTRRREVLDHLAAHGFDFAHDASNDDVSIPRNRIRAELLPLLRERFNPAIVDRLADEAELTRDDWTWIDDEAAHAAASLVVASMGERRIDAGGLARLPPALARALIWREMRAFGGERPVPFEAVEAARRLSLGPGAAFDAPGQRVERVADWLVLKRGGRVRQSAPEVFSAPLPIPGEVTVGSTGYVVSATASHEVGWSSLSGSADRRVAFVQLHRCGDGLLIRHRKPGDRFRPFGFEGRKTLQDLFVDRKVARLDRDRVPVVVDSSDRIVWVAGHAIAHEFRVTDPSQPVLVLKLKLSGGSA